jgi:hypothetical protein
VKLLTALLEGLDQGPGKGKARRWQQGDHLVLLNPHRLVTPQNRMLILILESQQQGHLKFCQGYLIH